MSARLDERRFMFGILMMFVAFFFSLAIMDYQIMHGWYSPADQPYWQYRYWIALGIVVVSFASSVSYVAHAAGMPKRMMVPIFGTVVMLFVAGLLDLFYYVLTVIKGEAYSFAVWSAQYKWFVVTGLLPDWTWREQIPWTIACLVVIAIFWRWATKERS